MLNNGVISNGAAAFSLAPGDGRGGNMAPTMLLAQPPPSPVQAPTLHAVPPPQATSPSPPVKKGVVVMDYTTDFPELPVTDAPPPTNGAPTAWAPKLRSTNVSVVFHLPGEERSSRATNFGEGKVTREQELCQSIAENMKCTIELSESKDGTLTVVLKGKRGDVDEARRRVVKVLQQQAAREIAIPKEHHRAIIGRNGERLKELQAETDCTVTVPGRDSNSDIVRISGPREGIDKAAHRIIELSEQQAKLANEHLIIERAYWPFIRGPNNESVEELQTRTKTRINIPPPSANNEVIVVSGDKEGVHAAVTQLKKTYADMKAVCKTINVQIPCAQHSYVIGAQGNGLAEILRTTNVSVEVPPRHAESATITLRGDPSQIALALPMVYQRATSMISREIECPNWLHRFIIGIKGKGINDIVGDRKRTQVDFEEDDRIVMQGPPEEVSVIEKELLALVAQLQADMSFVVVKVSPEHHRHVIGKGGSVVNKMKTEHGVQISIPDNATNSNEIKIEGPREGVDKCAKEIMELAARIGNERSRDVIIEQRFHRQLIGQGGAAVAEMRKKFPGVQFNFPEQGRKSDVVTLRGPKEAVDACHKHVTAEVKKMKEESYEEKVPIFKEFHRVIIGKGGANVRKIREDTGCRIDLPNENSGDTAITVTGRQEAVKKAVAQLQKIETELASIETAEVTIAHKLHSRMLGGGGRMISEISNECGGVNIKFPDLKSASDRVKVRGPKDDVAKATQLLSALAKDRELSSHEDSIAFPPEMRRFLIGRAGMNMRKIREMYPDVRIMVPRDTDADQETIHLVGREEEVAKVKPMLATMIKSWAETVEDAVEVDPVYHKHFVVRGAAVLRDIQEECGGCMISFPKPATHETTVTIKGSKEGVAAAKARIEQVVDDLKCTITEYVSISAEHHRSLLTRGGANIHDIQKRHNCGIRFPDRNVEANDDGDHSSTGGVPACDAVAVTGRPEAIAETKTALEALIPITRPVPVPFDMHRELIGRAGVDIRKFQETYDVNLKIPPAEERRDEVYVTGQAQQVDAAVEALAEKVDAHEAESYTVSVTVPVEYHSRIIGPRGASIDAYRKKFHVNVNVPKAGDNNNVSDQITIRGLKENADAAKLDIEETIAQWQNMIKQDCTLDPRIHSRIIGGRGKGIAKIMEEFKVDIRFPRADDADPSLVTVLGSTEDAVLDAVDHLKNLEEEYMQDHTERVQYERPPAPKPQKETPVQQMRISNAPWDMSNDFPTIDVPLGATKAAPSASGAWGRPR